MDNNTAYVDTIKQLTKALQITYLQKLKKDLHEMRNATDLLDQKVEANIRKNYENSEVPKQFIDNSIELVKSMYSQLKDHIHEEFNALIDEIESSEINYKEKE